jgi:hypothetical protein
MIYPNGVWGYIYELKCNKTNKRYVGHTFLTLQERLKNHKLKDNKCSSKKVMCNKDYEMKLLRECYVYSTQQLVYYEKKTINKWKFIYKNTCVNIRDIHYEKPTDKQEEIRVRNQRVIDNWNNTPENERYTYDPTKPYPFTSVSSVLNNHLKINDKRSMNVKDRLLDIKYKKYFNEMLDLLDLD